MGNTSYSKLRARMPLKPVSPMEEKHSTLLQPPVRDGNDSLPLSPNAGESTIAPSPPLCSQEAGRLFASEINQLPGVLIVEQWGGEGPGTPTFHVYVRPDDRDTEYAVYQLHGQIYDRYPEAYLEVVVLEAIEAPVVNSAASD